jgi:excisionase family DNA binding protein
MALYTLPEVAAELRVSVPTLRGWIKAGRMNVIRLPAGTIRIASEELDRLTGGSR